MYFYFLWAIDAWNKNINKGLLPFLSTVRILRYFFPILKEDIHFVPLSHSWFDATNPHRSPSVIKKTINSNKHLLLHKKRHVHILLPFYKGDFNGPFVSQYHICDDPNVFRMSNWLQLELSQHLCHSYLHLHHGELLTCKYNEV